MLKTSGAAQAFRVVDHQEHLGYFDEKGMFKKARAALIGKLQQNPDLCAFGYEPRDFRHFKFDPKHAEEGKFDM